MLPLNFQAIFLSNKTPLLFAMGMIAGVTILVVGGKILFIHTIDQVRCNMACN
jgi:hypothetical protein